MARFPRNGLCSMAAVSLVVLVIQNSLLVVMTRFSRNNVAPEDNYYTSTLILNQETLKMVLCLVIFAFDDMPERRTDSNVLNGGVKPVDWGGAKHVAIKVTEECSDSEDDKREHRGAAVPFSNPIEHSSVTLRVAQPGKAVSPEIHVVQERKPVMWWARRYVRHLREAIFKLDTFKLLLPAALFTLQNFLIFVGLSNLNAVSFQVWSQTKLLSAAIFSVWLLHRRLTWPQWTSLVVLTVGVLAAQLSSGKSSAPESPVSSLEAATTTTIAISSAITDEPLPMIVGDDANPLLGIAACVLSGLSSSYAGVYFEKVVKTTSPTLAIRNIQLSLFGIPLAFLSMLILDIFPSWRNEYLCGQRQHFNIFSVPAPYPSGRYKPLAPDGTLQCPVKPFYFWQNYDQPLTWGLVGIHALGGLLVALVVRYSDNIMKGFATGIAVIVSGLMSTIIWGYTPTVGFIVGSFLVTASTVMFHMSEAKQ